MAFSREEQPMVETQQGRSRGNKYLSLIPFLPSDLALLPPIGYTQLEPEGREPTDVVHTFYYPRAYSRVENGSEGANEKYPGWYVRR